MYNMHVDASIIPFLTLTLVRTWYEKVHPLDEGTTNTSHIKHEKIQFIVMIPKTFSFGLFT